MASKKEVLEIGGREVSISNPDKVYFPETGFTKMDLVSYYLSVADGALRGAGGRPMALKRFVDGAAGEPFFQKRAPDNTPDWIRTAELTFPSGRTADEIVLDEPAGLAWVVNLGRIDLNPHPVWAEDPSTLTSRGSTRPVPGVPVADPRGRPRSPRGRSRRRARSAGLRRPAHAGSTSTSGSSGRTYSQVRRAALALACDASRRGRRSPTISGGRRSATALPRLQPERQATGRSPGVPVRPLPDARVSMPLRWDEIAEVVAEDFTLATVPGIVAKRGDAGAGIDDAVGSLGALLELSARHEAAGEGDAPWPPNYAKQAGEPPRVQPSRARRPRTEYDEGRGIEGGPPPEVAAERAAAVAAGDPNAGLPTEWPGMPPKGTPGGSRPTPTGRRKTSIPVIEISRAATKKEALEGLDRWKERHPEAATHLEPADVLTDGMRGRSSLWYRVRVNLIHVPEAQRPPQEALDPDYDPWAGYEWPDRSGH